MPQPKLSDLVDRGYELSQSKKKIDKELDMIKVRLKAHGAKHEQIKIEGTKAEARFGAQSTIITDPFVVYDTYVDSDREEDFWDAISVKFPKVEEHLGKATADSLKTISSDPWGRITFVKKPTK